MFGWGGWGPDGITVGPRLEKVGIRIPTCRDCLQVLAFSTGLCPEMPETAMQFRQPLGSGFFKQTLTGKFQPDLA
jgi:hypothetical protein